VEGGIMPIYEFVCIKCGNLEEHFLSAPKDYIKCTWCGNVSERREIPSKLGPFHIRIDDPYFKIKELTNKKASRSTFGKYAKREASEKDTWEAGIGDRVEDRVKREEGKDREI